MPDGFKDLELKLTPSRCFSLSLAFVLISCGSEPEPASEAVKAPTPQQLTARIAELDSRIAPNAIREVTKENAAKVYRRLGPKRVSDANKLALWAARSAASSMCRTVNSVKISPDASRDQLAWDISCDKTLGISVSEKGALETWRSLEPSTNKSDGSNLPDMYAKRAIPQRDGAADVIGAAINLNGQLCARVIEVRPLKVRANTYEVTCTEYRRGSGTVRYLLDSESGIASRL